MVDEAALQPHRMSFLCKSGFHEARFWSTSFGILVSRDCGARVVDVGLVLSVLMAGGLLGLLALLFLRSLSLLVGGIALLQTLFFGSNHICRMSVSKSVARRSSNIAYPSIDLRPCSSRDGSSSQ
jgi:hypothetical protein